MNGYIEGALGTGFSLQGSSGEGELLTLALGLTEHTAVVGEPAFVARLPEQHRPLFAHRGQRYIAVEIVEMSVGDADVGYVELYTLFIRNLRKHTHGNFYLHNHFAVAIGGGKGGSEGGGGNGIAGSRTGDLSAVGDNVRVAGGPAHAHIVAILGGKHNVLLQGRPVAGVESL